MLYNTDETACRTRFVFDTTLHYAGLRSIVVMHIGKAGGPQGSESTHFTKGVVAEVLVVILHRDVHMSLALTGLRLRSGEDESFVPSWRKAMVHDCC